MAAASLVMSMPFLGCPGKCRHSNSSKTTAGSLVMPVPFLGCPGKCRHLKAAAACATSVSLAAPPSSSSASSKSHQMQQKQQLEKMEPDYYTMGYLRDVRAYGIHFKEGPDGVGVYAAKDMTNIERPRVILEVPMEILITVSKDPPWMFFPDIVPIGHPVFDVINSTAPESDYDVRLACLLLLALDQQENFWRLYGDYLPNKNESTDLLLATEEELVELQDPVLSDCIGDEQRKAERTWENSFPSHAPLKLKRLCTDSGKFKWAMGIARSRSLELTMTIGAKVQVAHILAPYADMLNHSFKPTCSLRWRDCDNVLEVVVKTGQTIKEGDEMTLNYLPRKCARDYMHRYGFSSSVNPWGVLNFSGSSKIHRDSFLSAFNICGLPHTYYYNTSASREDDPFVDGAVLAAARMLPFWSEEDLPFLPSMERRAVKELQKECRQLLLSYPTTYDQDSKILASSGDDKSVRWKAALRYRMDEKNFIRKVQKTLDIYLARTLF